MLQSLLILQPRYALLLATLMMLSGIVVSYALLSLMNYWIDPLPFILVGMLLQPLWAWRRLEAIVHFVEKKAATLQQFQATERVNESIKPSREIVLQHAKLLDHAIAYARSELDFLSSVVDEIPDAVAIFDPQDQLLLSNQKIKQLLGEKHFETGIHISEFSQHIRIPMEALFGPENPTGNTSGQSVFQLTTRSGLRDFLLKTIRLNSPSDGQLKMVILTDITELRQSQTQRDRALQFLSHDMRTPIASILSLTRATDQTTEAESQRQKITHHAKALLHMMDDFILTISAEAPRYKFKQELVDNLLNDAIEQVADLAEAKGVDLIDLSETSNVFIMTNTQLFLRALVNLLFNAVKFSPEGGRISIQVIRTPKQHNRPEHATICIRNPVEIQANSADLIPSMPGFGLGLDFVDNVIQKHHGTITREIPQNGMATIRITIPCVSG